MKFQLIMLDEPIIVSDEIAGFTYNKPTWNSDNVVGLSENNQSRIIVAGIDQLPAIDWNGLESEFNYVDVEKLAMDLLKSKWEHLYTFGYPKRKFPTNYENDLNIAKLSIYENQKLVGFTEEDMKNAFEAGDAYAHKPYPQNIEFMKEYFLSIKKPKVFDIEIEMESYCGSPLTTDRCPKCVDMCDRAYQRPKLTDNSIKILRKL